VQAAIDGMPTWRKNLMEKGSKKRVLEDSSSEEE
jgi:hypothetical protein